MPYILELKVESRDWEAVQTYDEPEEAQFAAGILHRARHHQTHLISEPKPLKWGEGVEGQTTARQEYIKQLFGGCETITYRIKPQVTQ